MKRILKYKGLLGGIIFFTVVIACGVALVATDNWENPLAIFSSSMGEGGRYRAEGFTPPDGFNPDDAADTTAVDETISNMTTTRERPVMDERPDGGRESGVDWSQFGHVLYNIWFLFAASGVVMLISLPFRYIRRQARRRNHQPDTVLQSAS